MKNILIILLLPIFIFSSCLELPDTFEEDDRHVHYSFFKDVLEWECEDFASSYYLNGTLNGEPICFGNEVNDYKFSAIESWSTITTTGTLYLGEDGHPDYRYYMMNFKKITEADHLIPKLTIKTPYFPGNSDYRHIFDSTFVEGPVALAQYASSIGPKQGISFSISGSYRSENPNDFQGSFTLSTAYGSQENGTFEITKIASRYEGEYEIFDIEATVDCNMYNHEFNLLDEPELYGRLQADMRLQAKFLLDE